MQKFFYEANISTAETLDYPENTEAVRWKDRAFCSIHDTRTARNKSLTGVGNAETSSSACDRKKSHYTKADRAVYFSVIEHCNKRNRRAVRDRTG